MNCLVWTLKEVDEKNKIQSTNKLEEGEDEMSEISEEERVRFLGGTRQRQSRPF